MAPSKRPNFYQQVNEVVDEHVVPTMKDIITDDTAPPFARIAASKFLTEHGKGLPQPSVAPIDERRALIRALRSVSLEDLRAYAASAAPSIVDAEYAEVAPAALPAPEDDPLLK